MKRIHLLFLFILLACLLAACDGRGVYSGKLILDGDVIVQAGQVQAAEILLLDGTLTVAESARLEGNVYQFLGDLTINGEVDGNVLQFGGNLALGPEATIRGDLTLSGNLRSGEPEEAVGGEMIRGGSGVPVNQINTTLTRLSQGLRLLIELLGLSLLAYGLTRAFPLHFNHIRGALGSHFIVSLAMGLLVGLVGLSLAVQMIFTVVLIPVALLIFLLFGVAVLLGWIGFGILVGKWLIDRFKLQWSPQLTAGVGTLAVTFLFRLLNQLPLIGGTLSLLLIVAALGAVFLTRFGWQKFVPASIA
jgi:hypothetical protein